jgi:putative transposase
MTKKYKLVHMLKVVDLPKSVYFYWVKKIEQENPDKELEEVIQSVFEENHGNYGYRRIYLALRNRGYLVNHKKVSRIMRKLGIQCVKFFHKSRRYRSYKGEVGKIAKNLIRRRFSTPFPYQKLATDITEFKYGNGQKLYLNPLMDLFNGEILSFEVSNRPNLAFVMKPLERALACIKGAKYRTTIHSDQGWHYQHAK